MKKGLLLLFLLPTLSWATIETLNFDTPKQEADYNTIIQELRCPQCQNNNIADSNSAIATDMRHKSLELLQQGKNKDQVIQYMVERYGNFVTYDPPITPATIFLWILPLLLIGVGIHILFRRKKSSIQAGRFTEKTTLDQNRLHQILTDKEEK